MSCRLYIIANCLLKTVVMFYINFIVSPVLSVSTMLLLCDVVITGD